MLIEAEHKKMVFFKVVTTLQIMGVFQKNFCILNISVRSTSMPIFIKMQNTWCNYKMPIWHGMMRNQEKKVEICSLEV